FGTNTMDVSATATAVSSLAPSEAPKGAMAPFAVSSCMFDNPAFWNNGAPVGDPPQKFFIVSGAGGPHCDGCACGQWTTFDEPKNDVPTVRRLIEQGNGRPIVADSTGQVDITETWIQPGTETSLYKTAEVWTGNDIRVV